MNGYFFKYFAFIFLITWALFSIQPEILYCSTDRTVGPDSRIKIKNLDLFESLKKIEREFKTQIKVKGYNPAEKKNLSFLKKDINSALLYILRNFNIKNYAILDSSCQSITIFTFDTHKSPASFSEIHKNSKSREDAISTLLLAGSPDDMHDRTDSHNQKPSHQAIKQLLEAGSPDEDAGKNAGRGTTNPEGKKEAIKRLIEAGSPDEDVNSLKDNNPEAQIAREEAINRLKEAGSPDGNLSNSDDKRPSQEAIRRLLEAGSPDDAATY
jgi:hypothetical protein